MRLKKRTVLITGGARGIGRALALDLAPEGHRIAICYRRSEAEARSAARAIEQAGGEGLALRCDVADASACAEMIDAIAARFGGVEVLVNAAGPYHRVPLLDETVEGWNAMFDNNLHPIFYLAKRVAPAMQAAGWGRIINFSMANADQMIGQTHVTAHYIAKVGVLVLTRSLAKLLAKDGVTVNAISPGFIDSGSAPAEELKKMQKKIPARVIGELKDAVSAVRYLLSDEARYVSGANLHLSGAWGV